MLEVYCCVLIGNASSRVGECNMQPSVNASTGMLKVTSLAGPDHILRIYNAANTDDEMQFAYLLYNGAEI